MSRPVTEGPPGTDTSQVEGRVLESGDTLVLTSNRLYPAANRPGALQLDTLRLAPDTYSGLQVRQLSLARTTVTGLAIAAVTTVITWAIFDGVDRNSPPPLKLPDPSEAIAADGSLLSTLWSLVGGR